jgi:hypothetical protein
MGQRASFRNGAVSVFTRVFDALRRRTRNSDASAALWSGFRVRAFGAPRNDEWRAC